MIKEIFRNINELKSYMPSTKTNRAFSNLYNFTVMHNSWFYNTMLWKWELRTLQTKCWDAECCMEKYYANNLINSDNAENYLKTFMYYDNYYELSRLEFLQMSFVNTSTKKILFIWGGSFPLSAIMLAIHYNIQIDIIDCDNDAIELGIKVINKLWLSSKVQYFYWNAENYQTDKVYDSVILAALIFQYSNTQIVIDNVKKIKCNSLLVRSSHWVRKLLYKPVNTDLLNKVFSPVIEVHPKNELINSILIYKNKQWN